MAKIRCSLCGQILEIQDNPPEEQGWIKREDVYFCSELHASVQPCDICEYPIEAVLKSIELHRDGLEHTIHCSFCSNVVSVICENDADAINSWNSGLLAEDYEAYVQMREEMIEKVKNIEGVDVTDEVEDKQDFFEQSVIQKSNRLPFWGTQRACTKCQKIINVNDYKIIVYEEADITLIHCPNYPECKGTDLNWVPR